MIAQTQRCVGHDARATSRRPWARRRRRSPAPTRLRAPTGSVPVSTATAWSHRRPRRARRKAARPPPARTGRRALGGSRARAGASADERRADRRTGRTRARASRPSSKPQITPSTDAQGEGSARSTSAAQARPARRLRPGRFGVRSPSRWGTSTTPSAPGGASSASVDERAVSTPRRRGAASVTFNRVQRATRGRKRPVASANPATGPIAWAVGSSLIVYQSRPCRSQTTTSPGRSPRAERGGHVVAGPRVRAAAPVSAHSPAASGGTEHLAGRRGIPGRWCRRRDQGGRSGTSPLSRRPVPGARRVTAVGPVRRPVELGMVSQSCWQHHLRRDAGCERPRVQPAQPASGS